MLQLILPKTGKERQMLYLSRMKMSFLGAWVTPMSFFYGYKDNVNVSVGGFCYDALMCANRTKHGTIGPLV